VLGRVNRRIANAVLFCATGSPPEHPLRADWETAGMTGTYRSLSRLLRMDRGGEICPRATNDLTTLRFTTEDIPEADRVARWRDHHLSLGQIEPAQDHPFEAREVSRTLPMLHLMSLTLSASRIVRTRVIEGNDEVALFVNRTGRAAISARGREALLAPGEGVLISCSDAMVYDRLSHGELLSIRVPRSVLSPVVVGIDDAIMRPIPRHSETLKLLTYYAGTLIDGNALAVSFLRNLAVNHLHDLIALTLGATRNATGATSAEGLRASRLRAAKAYIVENSSRHDLSVGAVADHLGVTPRYLQRLLEADGTTFSAFLLGQRLTRAYRMLCDLQFYSRPIGIIAYDVGFGDLSYFNRCFRRRYGVTPTEIREACTK
jgi:AraC-like DNA-binding protein/DNA-binding transcriptional MerR regulator